MLTLAVAAVAHGLALHPLVGLAEVGAASVEVALIRAAWAQLLFLAAVLKLLAVLAVAGSLSARSGLWIWPWTLPA